MRVPVVAVATLLGLALVVGGCASTSESAESDTLTSHVGQYSPPPSNLQLKRAGIPPFLDASDKSARGGAKDLGALAADQLTTLLVNSYRFDVIERAQLEQLLKEQGLEGIVDPNELAQPNRVRGVDYLVIGKVTNYRVRKAKTSSGLGIGRVASVIGVGEVKNDRTEITVDCGVDLRVVDSTTGSVIAAEFGEYKKTDSVKAMGVDVLGVSATAEGDLELSEDNHGKILRLALDHCLRKMMPKLDRALLMRQR